MLKSQRFAQALGALYKKLNILTGGEHVAQVEVAGFQKQEARDKKQDLVCCPKTDIRFQKSDVRDGY